MIKIVVILTYLADSQVTLHGDEGALGSSSESEDCSSDDDRSSKQLISMQEDLEGVYLAVQQCNLDLKKIGGVNY